MCMARGDERDGDWWARHTQKSAQSSAAQVRFFVDDCVMRVARGARRGVLPWLEARVGGLQS